MRGTLKNNNAGACLEQPAEKNKGITLIALIITIIVMLILVGVSVAILINSNMIGIAQDAADRTKTSYEDESNLSGFEAGGQKYNSIDEYLGTKEEEALPTTENYIGYYADLDADGTPEGIIYADLAHGKSGIWNNDSWSNYEYSAKSDLKSYYVYKKDYEGPFGKKDVLAQVSGTTGNDRFYVMALEDFTTDSYSTFYWYYNAYGKLDRAVATNYNDFGKGKSNTLAMLNDWNNNNAKYGAQNARDLWGVIQKSEKYDIVKNENDSCKWFVPSKAEWSAFGDYLYTKLGVTTSNYVNYGLSRYYWSSSQYVTDFAYRADLSQRLYLLRLREW